MSFEALTGLTITKIDGAHEGSEEIILHVGDRRFRMVHSQDCCETVEVNDITGDITDLIGSPVLRAEERSNVDETGSYESATWTFYELATIKGSVTIRWLGESNGYYSEDVDFYEMSA